MGFQIQRVGSENKTVFLKGFSKSDYMGGPSCPVIKFGEKATSGIHNKTPIPSVTYWVQWLHNNYHCDDVVTVL